jgi:hypothetical protein
VKKLVAELELPEAFEANDPTTLVELVNRVVDRGVSLSGDITISVADIDLLYVGLRLLLCSPNDVELGRDGGPSSRVSSGAAEQVEEGA